MKLDTEGLVYNLTGANKSFLSRVAKQQEEKYGNVDIFECTISDNIYNVSVEIDFGDYYIRWMFNSKGEIIDTIGSGQGHKYHKSLEKCAIELYNKYINDEII